MQASTPAATGTGVPSKVRPIPAAISAAPIVLIAVTSEAAVPAIWPIGSSAMALMLPKTSPPQPKIAAVQIT